MDHYTSLDRNIYLDVRLVQIQCFAGIYQGISIALGLEVCKAAVAIVRCHGWVKVNRLGIEVDSLVKLFSCVQACTK